MNTIKTILIAILLPIISSAQYKYKVSKCNSFIYSRNEWKKYQENYPTTMFVNLDSATFRINNEDHSVYSLYGEVKKEENVNKTTYTWDAYDKNNEYCVAVLTVTSSLNPSFSLTIFYEKECFNWVLTDPN